MGYTISTRAPNKKLQKLMADFMEKNYRPASEVFGFSADYSRFASNHYNENSTLSYDNNKLALGFDFNTCEPERDYIFAATRWMALKIGQTREIKELGKVPIYVYDGDDQWPVIIKGSKVTKKWEWCVVSQTGFKPLQSPHFLTGQQIKDFENKISRELARLEKLWKFERDSN